MFVTVPIRPNQTERRPQPWVACDSVKSQILLIMYLFRYSNKNKNQTNKKILETFFFANSMIFKYEICTLMTAWLKVKCRANLIRKHCKQIHNISNLRTLKKYSISIVLTKLLVKKILLYNHNNTNVASWFESKIQTENVHSIL